MSAGAVRPLVIVTLPGRTAPEVRQQALEAAALGADAAEVRFDRWAPMERTHGSSLFPSPIALVATLRSRAEGGEGPDDPAERGRWRKSAETWPFGWIDLELARDPIPTGWRGSGPRPIASRHLTPTDPPDELASLLDRAAPAGGFLKVVLPASVTGLMGLLPGLEAAPARGDRCVMTTGASGPLLRAWAPRIRSCAVYCSLDSAPASAGVEASQIPAGRFRRWLSAPPGAPLFAVVGSPVAHSLSPALHNGWMEGEDRSGLYVALDIVDGRELAAALPALAHRGFRGLSVTHPLKDAAFALATRRTPATESVGCANTLTLDGPTVTADNTDLTAAQTRMVELQGSYPGVLRQVLVVGAGGAARAALAAARNLGLHPEILARDATRAQELARRFDAVVAPRAAPGAATLVVQATTVGREGSSELGVPLDEWIDSRTYVLDFVYAPAHPTVRELVDRHGGRYEDGRRLLAYAAAASYGDWWGAPPSGILVEQTLRELP